MMTTVNDDDMRGMWESMFFSSRSKLLRERGFKPDLAKQEWDDLPKLVRAAICGNLAIRTKDAEES